MTRVRPKDRRASESFDIVFGEQLFVVTVGWPDASIAGPPVEVFVNSAKTTTMYEGLARDAAILISIALQHGSSLQEIVESVTRGDESEAATLVGYIVDEIVARGLDK